jgi:hypothetical protein
MDKSDGEKPNRIRLDDRFNGHSRSMLEPTSPQDLDSRQERIALETPAHRLHKNTNLYIFIISNFKDHFFPQMLRTGKKIKKVLKGYCTD